MEEEMDVVVEGSNAVNPPPLPSPLFPAARQLDRKSLRDCRLESVQSGTPPSFLSYFFSHFFRPPNTPKLPGFQSRRWSLACPRFSRLDERAVR